MTEARIGFRGPLGPVRVLAAARSKVDKEETMVKRVLWLGVAALLLTATSYAVITADKACDLKKVEAAWWCDKDAKFVDAKDVDTAKKLHKGTDHAVASVDACVKSYVQCQDCTMKWASDGAVPG